MAEELTNQNTQEETQETTLDDLLNSVADDSEDIEVEIVESQDIVKSMAKSGSNEEPESMKRIRKFLNDTRNYIKATEFRAYLENIKTEIINYLLEKTDNEDVKNFVINDIKTSMSVQYPIYQSCARLAKAQGLANTKLREAKTEKDKQYAIERLNTLKVSVVYPLFAYFDINPDEMFNIIIGE